MRRLFSSPYILLLIATLSWAGNFTIGKSLVSLMPPVTMAFIRWMVSIIVFLPFVWDEWKQNRPLFREHWKSILAMSATGIAGFNALTYSAMQYTTSVNASLMNSLVPIIVLILSLFWIRERGNWIQLVGILLSFIGVIWIITDGQWGILFTFTFNRGDVMMLVAVTMWAVYSILMKKYGVVFPLKSLFLTSMIIGWLLLIPFTLWEWGNWDQPIQLNSTQYIQLGYISLIPTLVAFLCWNRAVFIIGPSKASIYLNLIVLFTAIFSILFLGEKLVLSQIIGGVLVIIGVTLSTQLAVGRASKGGITLQEDKFKTN